MALHVQSLFLRARGLTRNSSSAWDLVQDTLERAIRGRPANLPVERVRGWLLVVMHHLYLDRCRAAARRRQVELTEDMLVSDLEDDAPEPVWKDLDLGAVESCVERLDPRLRDAYVLCAMQRVSLASAAERLGVPTATVGTRVLRARRKLRDLLVEPGASSAPGGCGSSCHDARD